MRKLKVLVTDDDPIVRYGLRLYLEGLEEISVVAACAGAADSLEVLSRDEVDVAFVDINLVGESGFEVMQKIAAAAPLVRVVLISSLATAEAVSDAVSMGACGVLPKTATPEAFLGAAVGVMSGCLVIHESLVQRSHTALGAARVDISEANLAGLSEREREVAELVAEAQTNRQIARALAVSESTVKTHLTSIFLKTGVGSRSELIRRMLEPS